MKAIFRNCIVSMLLFLAFCLNAQNDTCSVNVFKSLDEGPTANRHDDDYWSDLNIGKVPKIYIDTTIFSGYSIEDTVMGVMVGCTRLHLFRKDKADTLTVGIRYPNYVNYGTGEKTAKVGLCGDEYHFYKDGFWTFIARGPLGNTHIAFSKYKYPSWPDCFNECRVWTYAPCDFDVNDSVSMVRAFYNTLFVNT